MDLVIGHFHHPYSCGNLKIELFAAHSLLFLVFAIIIAERIAIGVSHGKLNNSKNGEEKFYEIEMIIWNDRKN